ncbi:MAG: GMP synthase subunit A [Thermoplasmata archaeon]|nr:GMP synthase subunit A [Thermoplasmata archaeon]
MKVYVVDNGGQWTHREWRVLRYLKVDTKIVPNTTPFEEIADVDGLILSGGAPSVACDTARMGNNGEYLDKADFPVLGICAGMQFLCEHFGGELGPGAVPEFGAVELEVSSHDDLFKGLPDRFQVWASHNDEVKRIPEGFEVTASSASCPHEAVRCLDRPIYGVQFHPEVENTEHGAEIFQNFLDIVAGQRA